VEGKEGRRYEGKNSSKQASENIKTQTQKDIILILHDLRGI